jgi:hypothetical protein
MLLVATMVGLSQQISQHKSKLPDLKFREDGKFQIAVFSDFHLTDCKLLAFCHSP